MDGEHVIPEAIRALLEKRSTFQEWLGRLDELGDEFRPEVTQKVRSDYAARLADVEGELEGHRAELEAALTDRAAAVDKVAREHDARSAELEETQLRHVVGEFDDDEWEARRGEHQVELDRLEADLTEQRSAVESLQTVLGELTGGVAGGRRALHVEPAATMPDDLPIGGDVSPEPGTAVEEEAEEVETLESVEPPSWMTQPFADRAVEAEEHRAIEVASELLELESEVDESAAVEEDLELEVEPEAAETPEAEATGVSSAGDEEPVEVEEPGEFMDELEFLESLSLDDADSFDAVSAMLDEDEAEDGSDEGSGRKREDS
jgi:hypothetical protein